MALARLAVLGFFVAAAPALAGMPVTQSMKCPVGGKTFSYTTTASYSQWGVRPDGKPYGSWEFPIELPKCPDNGLVVFDTFSKEDVQKLEPMVATAEYRAMAGRETNYYLAAWLMQRLGRDPLNVAWMIVQASWQADDRPELKARYQAEYVDRIRAIPKTGNEATWLFMQGRAVNGLRELGRFEEARRLLDSLSLAPLDVPIPEEQAAATASGLGRQVLNFDEIREAKRKRGFLNYFHQLSELIDQRDARSEPLKMLPYRVAAERCRAGGAELTGSDKAFCASAEVRN